MGISNVFGNINRLYYESDITYYKYCIYIRLIRDIYVIKMIFIPFITHFRYYV